MRIYCLQRNQMHFIKNQLFSVVGHNRVVDQLIRGGANVNLADKKFEQTALHLAAIKGILLIQFLHLKSTFKVV